MMKTIFSTLMFGAFCLLVVPGCGDAAPTSVVDGAAKSDIEKYEEMVAADAAAMGASMKDEGKAAPAAAAPAAAAPAEAPK